MEHRRGQRKVVSLLITLDTRYQEGLDGEIVDVSAGGACIRLEGFVPEPNTIVRLNFDAALPDETAWQCRALVVRHQGDAVGVMFDRRQDALFLRSLTDDANVRTVEKAARQHWIADAAGTTAGIR